MEAEVQDWILSHNLLQPGDRVTCAVSGGADSTAMLCCLLSLKERLGIEISAAHFNHRLRGEASDGDESFVRSFCEERGVPLFCGGGDAAAEALARGVSIEEAARNLRYRFLSSCPGLVATAHTADDNSETVLMNLIRGSGLKGLCGIPVRRGRIIRPMLCITHEEALSYLRERGLEWREDASNAEDDCRRNRLRHHVLPLIREENPAFSRSVLRCSETLRGELEYLESEARKLLEAAACEDGLRCSVLRGAPEPLLRRAIRLRAGKDFDSTVTERLLALIRNGNGSCLLPDGRRLRCSCDVLTEILPDGQPDPVLLEPGETLLFGRYEISCRRIPEGGASPVKNARIPCIRDPGTPLTVRCRREGDTILAPGGEKSLKELMIEKKIPAPLRGGLPVFCCGDAIAAVYRLDVAVPFRPLHGEPFLQISVRRNEHENTHPAGAES